MDSGKLARHIVEVLEDKKGEEITLLDLTNLPPLTDYFVICSALSDRTLRALLDAVIEDCHEKFGVKPRLEGKPADGWLLADFGGVVVHLFSHSQRDYYQLEDLWSEAKVLLHVQ